MIRPIEKTDVPTLAPLHAAAFDEGRWSASQILSSLELTTTIGWVSSNEDGPYGFILLQLVGLEAEVLTFCISPKKQGQGRGRRLLHEALIRLPQSTQIFLEVAADNAPARAIYEKEGFIINGLRRFYYHRGPTMVDALTYVFCTPPVRDAFKENG